jgi:hypothetical protein
MEVRGNPSLEDIPTDKAPQHVIGRPSAEEISPSNFKILVDLDAHLNEPQTGAKAARLRIGDGVRMTELHVRAGQTGQVVDDGGGETCQIKFDYDSQIFWAYKWQAEKIGEATSAAAPDLAANSELAQLAEDEKWAALAAEFERELQAALDERITYHDV